MIFVMIFFFFFFSMVYSHSLPSPSPPPFPRVKGIYDIVASAAWAILMPMAGGISSWSSQDLVFPRSWDI